jgi:hypothetical protein
VRGQGFVSGTDGGWINHLKTLQSTAVTWECLATQSIPIHLFPDGP